MSHSHSVCYSIFIEHWKNLGNEATMKNFYMFINGDMIPVWCTAKIQLLPTSIAEPGVLFPSSLWRLDIDRVKSLTWILKALSQSRKSLYYEWRRHTHSTCAYIKLAMFRVLSISEHLAILFQRFSTQRCLPNS